MGLPELGPGEYENRLISDGVYARVCHSRYLELTITLLAYALFSNSPDIYVVFLLSLLSLFPLVWVEEK